MPPPPPEAFELPVAINLAAVVLFALSGGLAALRRGYDLIGLLALALLTAVGGSLIRDGVFIQQGPPAIATDGRYILAVVAGAAVSLAVRGQRFRRHLDPLIAHADALGLGAYAVVGAQKSLVAGLSPPAAVLVGVINAAGGGLLRDIVTREEPLVFRPGQFYVLTALAGASLYVTCASQAWLDPVPNALATIAVTYLLRALSLRYDWRTTRLDDA